MPIDDTGPPDAVVEAVAPASELTDQVVQRYIALRDKRAEMKAAYEERERPLKEAMERIETFLLGHLQRAGAESVRTAAGTFYQTTRTSATVADWPAYLDWVRNNDAWGALEQRVNKTFVSSFKEEHNDLPPGVNWREERTVNVRRS